MSAAIAIRAVIIAGGRGRRACSMTGDRIPKALLPVVGIPIAFRQLTVLAREGVRAVTVLAGHLGDELRYGIEPEAARLGLDLEVLIEGAPLGTAGCLTSLKRHLEESLLIVYGDMLFDLALAPLLKTHRLRQALLTIVAHPNDHPDTSDLLVVGDDGLVSLIIPSRARPLGDRRNLVPAGIYLAAPGFINHLCPGERADMIKEVVPRLIGDGLRVAAYSTPEYLRDVGTPKRWSLAERDIAAGRVEMRSLHRARPAVFLDIDGVLTEELGGHGALTAEGIRLLPRAGAAVGVINNAGALAIAITNRPQMAKGLISRLELDTILGRIEALLASEGGVLDRIYFCPHHPQSGFACEVPELKIACDCRKPAPGLLLRAAQDLNIDMSRSAVIGDSLRDIGAAHLAGLPGYGVRTGYGCRDRGAVAGSSTQDVVPDLMFNNVAEAVDFALYYEELACPLVAAIGGKVSTFHGAPILISLSGYSRVGKSILTHALARTFNAAGRATLIAPLDQWIKPLGQRESTDTAEQRHQVDLYREFLLRLKRRGAVTAPGYDVATRGKGVAIRLDAADKEIILVDGVFAAHRSIRDLIDYSLYIVGAEQLMHSRFVSFYQWKGLSDREIKALWRARGQDELPLVAAQASTSDVVITFDSERTVAGARLSVGVNEKLRRRG